MNQAHRGNVSKIPELTMSSERQGLKESSDLRKGQALNTELLKILDEIIRADL